LAHHVKESIRQKVGEHLRCSVGLGPNQLLAKVASDMEKPDGLTIIRKEELPERLFELKLRDFPGIGPRMERRLRRAGVTDVERLCRYDLRQLSDIWGSRLLGAGWWHKLRGEDVPERPTRTRSMGHSRVLPPEQRHPDEAWSVLMRLIHKVAARLRHDRYWAGSLTLDVHVLGGRHWHLRRRIDQCQDTLTFIREVGPLWQKRPPGKLLKVGVVLSDLVHERNRTPSLFEPERKAVKLAQALDGINRRFGLAGAHFAGMHGLENQYTTRIAFNTVPNLELADA
jgi:DNA polymerase-4